MSLNLAVILRESARNHPERDALLFTGGSVSYAELDAASDRFATGLLARGLGPGDAVALQLPNVPQFVVIDRKAEMIIRGGENVHRARWSSATPGR